MRFCAISFAFLHRLRRHSLARQMTESDGQQPEGDHGLNNELGCNKGRLRRCSSIDTVNVAILLENNTTAHAPAEPAAPHQPLVKLVVEVEPEEAPKGQRPKLQRMSSIEEIEMASCRLEPRVEGRIVVIGPDTLPGLLNERQRWERSVTPTIPEAVETN